MAYLEKKKKKTSSASQFYPILHLTFYVKKTFKNTFHTCKQPLMMAYERFGSAWDNFGKFIHQF